MSIWFTPKLGAQYCSVTPRTFRQWLKLGLSHSRPNRKTILVNSEDLDEFLRRFMVSDDRVDKLVSQTLKELNA